MGHPCRSARAVCDPRSVSLTSDTRTQEGALLWDVPLAPAHLEVAHLAFVTPPGAGDAVLAVAVNDVVQAR